MKKKIAYGIFLMAVAISFTSCEALFKKCKVCRTVTYEDGVEINSTDGVEDCGADLVKQEAIPDVKVGHLVTNVEGR
jgi:hypothetical protein